MADAAPEEQSPWAGFVDSLDKYWEAVAKEEAGELAEGERTPTDLKPGVDTTYWRTMTDLVSALIPKDADSKSLPENLFFDEKLAFGLNFGVVYDHPKFAWARELLQPFMPDPPKHTFYECVYVTQVLNQAYRDVRRVDVIRKLEKELERIEQAMLDAPVEREDAQRRRDQSIERMISVPSDAQKLTSIYHQLDQDLEMYKMMEIKMNTGGFGGLDERQKYISTKQTMEGRAEDVGRILDRNRSAAEEIRKADEEADKSLDNLLSLRDEKREVQKKISTEKSAVRSISVTDIKAALEEEVGKIKGNGRLTSKLGKTTQISIPLEERSMCTPDEAFAAMEEIEEMDPNLFNNRGVKRKGKPQLYIAPCIGEGIYDWEGHRLMIPTMVSKTTVAATASAVVAYKVDVDQSYNDRELVLSYKNDIKENKKVRSMIKLRQQLVKDYLTWITKEAKGFPLMEKDIRAWFEYRIAPNKFEPKLPKDMRNLTMRQLRDGLAAEMKKPESTLTLTRTALFHYLIDGEDSKILDAEVFPRMEKAREQDPENLDLIYSLATIYRKVKNKKCVDLLLEYCRTAPQSWYSKKAQELVTSYK